MKNLDFFKHYDKRDSHLSGIFPEFFNCGKYCAITAGKGREVGDGLSAGLGPQTQAFLGQLE